ncbi:RcpC/CpaB family pilus assembly protein [Nocardioides ultimimeridianus]
MDPRTPPSRQPFGQSSPGRRLGSAVTRVRRLVLRRRRVLAAGLTAVAVGGALHTLAPPAPASTAVTVAVRDLPAGATLTAADVATAHLPPDAVPDGLAVTTTGRTLAAPLTRGEPITEPRLVGAGLVGADPGTTAVAVRISDPGQVALLTVGDRIDLLATDPQHATTSTLASDVTVLAVPPESPDTAGGALTGRLVVLAIPASEVEDVTAASVAAFVTYAWHNQ